MSILIGAQRGIISDEDKATYARLVGAKQTNTMEPSLTKWIRQYQISGQVEGGEITIDWGTMEVMTELQKTREETQIGAMRLLQKRMEGATDENGDITDPNAEGTPESKDLVKLISMKK